MQRVALTCNVSFYPAIRETLKAHQSATKRREAEKQGYENLVAKLREAIAILNEAQQLCVLMTMGCRSNACRSATVQAAAPQQEQQVLKEVQNIEYMENKRREYQTKNAALQNQVASLGLTPDLHHSALVQQSEEVARLNAAIAPKLQSLKSFGDLPPVRAFALCLSIHLRTSPSRTLRFRKRRFG